MENATAMYQEADDESREWEGFLLLLHRVFYSEAFTVADIVEKINGKTAVPGSFSEPTPHARELRAALPGFLAEAMDRPGFCQRRIGHAFAGKMDRRFGESGVHLKKGTMLAGRQQWEVAIPGANQHYESPRQVG